MAYLTISSPPPTQHRSGSRRTGTEWPLAEFSDLTRLSDTGGDSCGTRLILMHTTLAWIFKDTECRTSCWVCLCRHSNSYALAHLRGHNPCPEARTRLLPEVKSPILICTRAGELAHLGTACILCMEVPGFGYKGIISEKSHVCSTAGQLPLLGSVLPNCDVLPSTLSCVGLPM